MAEPDPRNPRLLRVEAIRSTTAFVAGVLNGRSTPCSALPHGLAGRFDHAWTVPIGTSDGREHHLLLLADRAFPYRPPRLALSTPPPLLTWPHVEANGLLCLHGEEFPVPADDPVAVVRELLSRARGLLETDGPSSDVRAFREEFLSYWNIAAADDGQFSPFISLVEPRGPVRFVATWRHGSRRAVAESDADLNTWLRRMRWIAEDTNPAIRRGLLLWLPRAIIPSEYPATALDVRQMASRVESDETGRLVDLVASKPAFVDLVFGMGTPSAICFAMVSVDRPKPVGGRRKSANPLTRGFRSDRVPKHILFERYFTRATRATKTPVERADHAWVHGRDHDPQQMLLRRRRVGVIGCGSLGGPVARLLAQTGVGNLLLIDPDTMKWENLSRHVLGAESVGQNKAEALAESIRSAYPHLGDVTGCPHELVGGAAELIAQIEECDLVLEATGAWSASNLLNDIRSSSGQFPTVVYAWLERAASAAHALVSAEDGGCLRCGVEADGNPLLAVTQWDGGAGANRLPECGGAFTPYGAVELSSTHALVLEVAVRVLLGDLGSDNHWVWIGSRDRIAELGGRWSDEWLATQDDPGTGYRRVRRKWRRMPGCPVCGT